MLTTQSELGPQILSFSRSLDLFTAQLKADDPNLRRLVNAAPPAATQLEGLIRETGPDLSRVLANLLTTVRIVQPRLAGVEQFLVTYPGLSAAAPSVVPGRRPGALRPRAEPQRPALLPERRLPAPGRQRGPADDLAARGRAPARRGRSRDGFFPMNTTVWCNQGGPIDPRGSPARPAAQRRQAALRLAPGPEHGLRAGGPCPTRRGPTPATPASPSRAGRRRARPPPLRRARRPRRRMRTRPLRSPACRPPQRTSSPTRERGAPPIVIPGLG